MALLRFRRIFVFSFVFYNLRNFFSHATPFVNFHNDNGREIFDDFSNGNDIKNEYLSRNKRIFDPEPVVINGQIVSGDELEKIRNEDFLLPTTTALSTTILTNFLRDPSPICFQVIKNRNLLHSSFVNLNRAVSRNECRCACAKTWTGSTGPKCQSIQYNPVTKSCSLNKGNHLGKYDLILDLFHEYHYVTCGVKWLLQIAEYKCLTTPLLPLETTTPNLPESKSTKSVHQILVETRSLSDPIIELVPPQDNSIDRVLPTEFGKVQAQVQPAKTTSEIKDIKNGQTKEDIREKANLLNAEYETEKLFNTSATIGDVEKRLNLTFQVKMLLAQADGLHPEITPPDDGVFAHDILLTEDQSNSMIEELQNIIAGKNKRNSLFFEKLHDQKWNDITIPFTIDQKIHQIESLHIFNAIRQLESQTCLRFMYSKTKPHGNHIYYAKFDSLTRCGVSYIGKKDPANVIYLSFACPNFTSIVLHETMHALGVNHQHMRPDRDEFVEILWNNVNPRNLDYFAMVSAKNYTSYGVPYDYGSLLHYTPYTATLKKDLPTMVAKINPEKNFKIMGQKRGPSRSDIELLNKMYCLSAGCVDKSVYCGAWSLINSCSTNGWMQKNCQKSCNICN